MKFHLKTGGVKQSLKKYLAQGLFLGLLFQGVPLSASAQTVQPSASVLPYSLDQSTIHLTIDQLAPLGVTTSPAIEVHLTESVADKELRLARQAAVHQTHAKTSRGSASIADPDLATKRALVQKAATAYGIPWQVLEAVWQVESGKSWDTNTRSSAGAQGPAQFMPGTWRAYGVDADGDGVANIHSAVDAVTGAAHYLAANGADRGNVRQALLAYNHANWYVEKVLGVARDIGYTG